MKSCGFGERKQHFRGGIIGWTVAYLIAVGDGYRHFFCV